MNDKRARENLTTADVTVSFGLSRANSMTPIVVHNLEQYIVLFVIIFGYETRTLKKSGF